MKHREKDVISQDPMGEYHVHGALTSEAARCVVCTREQSFRKAQCATAQAASSPEESSDEQRTNLDATSADDQDGMEHEWRDMSGDALTSRQADAQAVPHQDALAAVRNLRRNKPTPRTDYPSDA